MTKTQLPKYEQVKRWLIHQIRAGEWKGGVALPSEAQLVNRFKVSRPTLSRAMRELAHEGYLRREQGRGTFVADRHQQANPPPTRRIDVFISDLAEQLVGDDRLFLTQFQRGMDEAARVHHATLQRHVVPADADVARLGSLFASLRPNVAVLLEPAGMPHLRPFLKRLNCPVWIANEPVDGENCVLIDQMRAGYLATQCLIAAGRRHIALLTGTDHEYWGYIARREGYQRALAEAGLPIDPRYIFQERMPIDSEAGRAMMRQLLARKLKVDGVVCGSDRKAIGAMAAAHEAGLAVPRQIAFVGIDNNLAQHADPPLTAVYMPERELGYLVLLHALHTANARTDTELRLPSVHTLLAPSLAVRASGGRGFPSDGSHPIRPIEETSPCLTTPTASPHPPPFLAAAASR